LREGGARIREEREARKGGKRGKEEGTTAETSQRERARARE
jgi:hypothetical protein